MSESKRKRKTRQDKSRLKGQQCGERLLITGGAIVSGFGGLFFGLNRPLRLKLHIEIVNQLD
jgi:hypothetical protein